MFNMPGGEGAHEGTDDNPIIVPSGVTKEDFDSLLVFIYGA
jgi:hypothetical protein